MIDNIKKLARGIGTWALPLAAIALTAGTLAAQPSFDNLDRSAARGKAGTIGAQARPTNPAARDRRACIGLQHTISSAIEMYNMDQNANVERLDLVFLKKLVDQGYLQKLPEDPGWGPGTASHFAFDASGNGVTCRVHGSDLAIELTEAQSCYLNELWIAGAIEMYSRDNNLKPDRITPELLAKLVQNGYLETLPEDPGQGSDTAGHYVFTQNGNGVTCTVHGSPSAPKSAAPVE